MTVLKIILHQRSSWLAVQVLIDQHLTNPSRLALRHSHPCGVGRQTRQASSVPPSQLNFLMFFGNSLKTISLQPFNYQRLSTLHDLSRFIKNAPPESRTRIMRTEISCAIHYTKGALRNLF